MLDRITDELYRANRDGERLGRDTLAFDALVLAARRSAQPVPVGDGVTPKRDNPRFLALLRADVTALQRGAVEGDELCEIAGVGPIPIHTARRLLGDAVLKLVITRGVDVANVVHLGRGPNAAQKVALWWSSPGCIVEGCSRAHTEFDHREDFARTRHTTLSELEPMCDPHHDRKTYERWALVAGTGKRPFVPPDDPRHPNHEPRPVGSPLVDGAARRKARRDVATSAEPNVFRPTSTHPPSCGSTDVPRPVRGAAGVLPEAQRAPPPIQSREEVTRARIRAEPGAGFRVCAGRRRRPARGAAGSLRRSRAGRK